MTLTHSTATTFDLHLLGMSLEEVTALHAWIYRHLPNEPGYELVIGTQLAGEINNELNNLMKRSLV